MEIVLISRIFDYLGNRHIYGELHVNINISECEN